MVGFVGVQARRRKRNRILIIFVLIFIFVFTFYLPSINISNEENQVPTDVLPDNVEDKTSLATEIEELKLEIFQKDQRIKFRDGQINDLIEENKILKQSLNSIEIEYQKSLGNISELENDSSKNSTQNKNEINILENKIKDLNVLLQNYKIEINKIKQELDNSISPDDFDKINIENSILKNEIKLIQEKNIKSESILDELENLIDEKQKQIDELLYLKDLKHHG